MSTRIELRSVDAGYGARPVIHGLSANFPRHRVSAVLGPGASGKSTLLRVLEGATTTPWSVGSVPSLDAWRLPQRRRDGPASPETRGWDDAVSVLATWLRARSQLLSPSMWTALLSCPSALTRLASILQARAELLLLDEPDVSDVRGVQNALTAIIRRLRTEGHTIVLVTRNLKFARDLADHVVLLVDGVKLDEGSLPQLQRAPASTRVRDFLTWGG